MSLMAKYACQLASWLYGSSGRGKLEIDLIIQAQELEARDWQDEDMLLLT